MISGNHVLRYNAKDENSKLAERWGCKVMSLVLVQLGLLYRQKAISW
jgi:hypothetical protein